MELFKLDSVFKPSTTIKDFKSLSWVERHQVNGEFKLVVEDDVSILTTLPTGTLLSHTDTREVMIVENHEIERNSERKLITTVSGRSFETFLEKRITTGAITNLTDPVSGDAIVDILGPLTSADAAQRLISNALESGVAATANVVANLSATVTMRVSDVVGYRVIPRGQVYPALLELLKLANAGIKTTRPAINASVPININVHDGLDLRNVVVFYGQYEDLDDAQYFWSIKEHMNYAWIATKYAIRQIKSRDETGTPTGLNRKELYMEAPDLEEDYVTYVPGTVGDVVDSRAQAELKNHTKLALMQATISPTAKPKFKIDYDVGDLVTVFGEFGVAQSMRVTEHILTLDDNGMQGYPSLTIV